MTTADTHESYWCPKQQIFLNGSVPNLNDEACRAYLDASKDLSNSSTNLRIFGYGSLCWRPDGLLCDANRIKRSYATALGYKRCWCQKSADHRGTADFCGIVCTLLSDEEVASVYGTDSKSVSSTYVTEGVVYEVVPKDGEDHASFIDQLLEELDFREKGGYARDLIDVVVLDEVTNEPRVCQALLYRGTHENPAFWKRAMMDLKFAAARIAVSHGPSGWNSEYLFHLEEFMKSLASNCPDIAQSDIAHIGDTETRKIAEMTRNFMQYTVEFMYGCGSNKHNQLMIGQTSFLLEGSHKDEVRNLVEFPILLSQSCERQPSKIKSLYAGGGHSGLLLENGDLFLWGWNDDYQLGVVDIEDEEFVLKPLKNLKVEMASLGHNHTLVLEKLTGFVYSFGSNSGGKCCPNEKRKSVTVSRVIDERCENISAGVFHSAAISCSGELITFGCNKFGQCLPLKKDEQFGRWRPSDGCSLVQVCCGYKHTLILDEHGRIWAMGSNKFGQLGSNYKSDYDQSDGKPSLVSGRFGEKGSGCYEINCGWSHSVALVRNPESAKKSVYGWGRNDKGQLGIESNGTNICTPVPVFEELLFETVKCGSEYTMIVDTEEKFFGCGWNEHGNLSTGTNVDRQRILPVLGESMPSNIGNKQKLIAVGGAHFITAVT